MENPISEEHQETNNSVENFFNEINSKITLSEPVNKMPSSPIQVQEAQTDINSAAALQPTEEIPILDIPLKNIQKVNENKQEDSENQTALRKSKETAAKLFGYIEKYPQPALIVGSSVLENGKKILRANHIGSICLNTPEINKTIITVEYSDTNRMKKKVFENTHDFSLADIAENAYILAAKGMEENIDEYEEDENKSQERSTGPVLYFCLATKDSTWSIEFLASETIENIAISSKYVYVLNSNNLIRVFDYGRNEVFQFSFEAVVVAICAFEHFLAVFYHTGLPLNGIQSIRARVYNIDQSDIQYEIPVAVTRYKRLQWCGFSDDGVLYTQDSSDVIRVLMGQQIWVPIFENDHARKFWLLGVMDRDLVGYRLAENEPCPNPSYRYNISIVPWKIQIANTLFADRQEQLIKSKIEAENNRKVHQNFAFIKNTETTNPLRAIFKSKIKDLSEIKLETNKMEAEKVDYVRKLLVDGKTEAAIHFALQIKTHQHFEIVLKILDQLKLKKVKEELTKLANEFGYFDMIASQTETIDLAQNGKMEMNYEIIADKKEQLKRFLDENNNGNSGQHSFEEFKNLNQKAGNGVDSQTTNSVTETEQSFANKFTVQKQLTGRSIMEDLGRKNKQQNKTNP